MTFYTFHNFSPLIYMLYIHLHKNIHPCPSSCVMKDLRKLHNIILSFFSFGMFIGMIYSLVISNKFESYNSLVCKPFYTNDRVLDINIYLFLYSKYLEWLDTTFLYLSNKPISWLQYSHHMSTAILSYNTLYPFYSSYLGIPFLLNTLIHIPMYWYFAYPKGVLYKFRSLITVGQICQHIIVLGTIVYSLLTENCQQNIVGQYLGLLLFLLYLVMFSLFYLQKYVKSNKKISYKEI